MTGNKQIHQQHWKKSISAYNLIKKGGPVTRQLQKLLFSLVSMVPENELSTVFEVGCGQGARLELIRSAYPKVFCAGSDISSVAIKAAKKNYPDFSFFVDDIVASSLRKKYDLVLCLDVLEHIEDDELALRNIRKITRKYCIFSSIQGRMRPSEGPEGHIRNYGYEELIGKVKRANFAIEEVVEWGFPFYSPFYRDTLSQLSLLLAPKPSRKSKMKTEQRQSKSLLDEWMPLFLSILGEPLYQLMNLNVKGKGDYIFILAKVK